MDVYVKFLGIPKIYVNDEWVNINKNKLNLIVLYILYNENCTRDELAGIFWPENDEIRGKSNLRNALYQIRKILGEELLQMEGHAFVRVSPKVNLKKDIDLLLDPRKSKSLVLSEDLIFMDKMHLRDNAVFSDWLYEVKRAYENNILNILNIELNKSISSRNIADIENYSNKIIDLAPYNETAYREKIKIHILNHDFNEGIKIFKELEKKVKEDLGVPLENETIQLYEYMINKKKNRDEADIREYFERANLSLVMTKEFNKFIGNRDFKHIIVRGEIGVGKSKLIEDFLKSVSWKSYTMNLKQTITDMEFLAYYKMLDLFSIGGDNSLMAFKKFLQEMKKRGDKILLYIKNIEYIDRRSLDYISELLLDSKQVNIFVIVEISDSIVKDFTINQRLKSIDNFIRIHVPLLSIHETIDYIKFKTKNPRDSIMDREDIYKKTYGNITFIDELLDPNTSTDNIVDKLISSFNPLELEILKKASVFQEDFTIDELNILLAMDRLSLINELEPLFNKRVFIERGNRIQIKYKSLKTRLYNKIPKSHALEFHKLLGQYYEKKGEFNYEDLRLLTFHYERIGDEYKKSLYRLKSLQIRLDYYDQLFPTLIRLDDRPKDFYLDREKYYEEFRALRDDIEGARYRLRGEEYHKLNMILEFIKGRSMIIDGEGERGILSIERLISMAKKSGHIGYLLKAYIEYIHYGIHRDNNLIIKKYIKRAWKLVNREDFYIEYAEITRLEGLYELRVGNLHRAENLLKKSIEIYDIPSLSNGNFFPIAAAKNYLGQLYVKKGEYKEAEKYFLKAIEICLKYDLIKSLDIFYADYGYMLFVVENYKKAEKVLDKAIEICEILGSHWKRATVETLLGKIALSRGETDKALSHLRNGEIFSRRDRKPEEINLLNSLKEDLNKLKGGRYKQIDGKKTDIV